MAERLLLKIIYLIVVPLLVVGCGEQVKPLAPIRIKIAGSTAMRPLLEDLTEAYSQRRRHVSFDIRRSGSSTGLDLIREGQVDIGTMPWLPEPEEESQREERRGLRTTTIALDGLAIVVYASNPVENLTLSQLRDIFCGRILDWREVGGRVGDILVVSREDSSDSRRAFETMVMGKRRVALTAVVMPSSQAVVEYVAGHPNSIGYVSMGYLSSEVKALQIEGLAPTPETVGGRDYPLVRPLSLLIGEEPSEEIEMFIDFILSPAGQAIVGERYGRVR